MNALAKNLEQPLNVTEPFLESVLPREIAIVPRPDGEGFMALTITIRERNGDRIFRNLYGIEAQQLWAAVNRASRVAKNDKRRKPE
jgi:hypothetical protein